MPNTERKDILSLKIIQKNLNKRTEASYLLTRQHQDKDLFLLQEPYFSQFRTFGLSGINRFIYANNANKPLTVIALNNRKYKLIKLPECSEFLTACIFAQTGFQSLLILNCYCPPSKTISSLLKSVETVLINYSGHDVLFCGDFNSRHVGFGDIKTNLRGKQLLDFVTCHKLELRNHNTLPTFLGFRGSSKIDLVFHRSIQQLSYVRCDLDTEREIISDHLTIRIRVDLKNLCTSSPMYEFIPGKLKDDTIRSLARNIYLSDDLLFRSCADIDEYIDSLTKDFNDMKRRIIKNTNRTVHFQSDWWNIQLEQLRSAVIAARRHLQRARRTNANVELAREVLNQRRRAYRKEIIAAKLTSWKRSCEKSKPWDIIYKIAFGKVKTRDSIDYIDSMNGPVTETREIVASIADRFFPADDQSTDSEIQKITRLEVSSTYQNCNLDSPITRNELLSALKEHNPDKAPGFDQITLRQWKIIYEFQTNNLLNMFNYCYFAGYFPKSFKKATISLIRKPNKRTNEISSFRPISLLPVCGKVFETIINKRLVFYLHNHGHTNINQYGFVRYKSTTDLLHDAMLKVQRLKTSRRLCALVQIDIASAFDRAWHCEILRQLRTAHVPRNIYQLISSYLSEREANINIHNQTVTLPLGRGCPQGSILGPSLWNLTIYDVLNMSIPGTEIFAYADDVLLICDSISESELEKTVEAALTALKEKLLTIKLNIANEKLHVLYLSRRRNPNRLRINFDGRVFESVDKIVHLGVHIDRKLSWNEHLDYLKTSAKIFVGKARRIAKTTWGIGQSNRDLLYNAVLVPKMTYGCSIWFHKLNFKKYRDLLNQIQRFILSNLFGYWKTVSTAAVQVLTNKKPLFLTIIDFAIVYMLKRNDKIGGFPESVHQDFRQIPDYLYSRRYIHPSDNYYSFSNSIIRRSQQDIFTVIDQTDWLLLILTRQPGKETSAKKIRMSDFLSMRDAGLTALVEASKFVNANLATVHIYVEDPRTLRFTNRNNSPLDELAKSICLDQRIHVIATNTDYYMWVKNQLIMRKNEIELISGSYRTYSHMKIKMHLNNQSLNWWQANWQLVNINNITRSIFPNVTDRSKLRMPNSDEVRQLLSGHGRFNAVMHRFGHQDIDYCHCNASTKQTSRHLLFECPDLEIERRSLARMVNRTLLNDDSIMEILMNTVARAGFVEFARKVFQYVVESNNHNSQTITITGSNLRRLIYRVRWMRSDLTEEERDRAALLTNLPNLTEEDHRYIG